MRLAKGTPRFEKRTPELRLKLEGWRSRLVFFLAAAGFAALAGRAFYLQGMNHGFLHYGAVYGQAAHALREVAAVLRKAYS